MSVLTPTQGYLLILAFGLGMLALTYAANRLAKWTHTSSDFLVAGRRIGWLVAAPSIAASWIWAPALFVSVQKSYELGLAGLFWFTAPNILALVIFAFLGPRIRKRLPRGFTLPDWIKYRLDDRATHRLYLVPYLWYQVMAVCVQLFVGGMMLNFLTGIPLNVVMVLMLVVALGYSLPIGLRASIITDFLQMAFIFLGCIVVIPWVIATVGWGTIRSGLAGTSGSTSVMDPGIAFSFGIVTAIGLIAGAVSDQQYWQRVFAIRERDIVPAFVLGGIMFGVVPIALSVLGFVPANPDLGISLPPEVGLPMIGVATVVELLPIAAGIFFVLMLLAGLSSTLDSGLCAASSLYAVDIAPLSREQRRLLAADSPEDASEEQRAARRELDRLITRRGRAAMFGIAILGLATALVVQHLFSLDRLWWIFNGFASCFLVPTVLSLYYDRLSAKGVKYAILSSFLGMAAFIYGNWIQDNAVVVGSALFIVVVGLCCCLLFRRSEPWRPSEPNGTAS